MSTPINIPFVPVSTQEPIIIWSPNHNDQFVIVTNAIDLYQVVVPTSRSQSDTSLPHDIDQSVSQIWADFINDVSARLPHIDIDLARIEFNQLLEKKSSSHSHMFTLLDSVVISSASGKLDVIETGDSGSVLTSLETNVVTSATWQPCNARFLQHLHSQHNRARLVSSEYLISVGFESGCVLSVELLVDAHTRQANASQLHKSFTFIDQQVSRAEVDVDEDALVYGYGCDTHTQHIQQQANVRPSSQYDAFVGSVLSQTHSQTQMQTQTRSPHAVVHTQRAEGKTVTDLAYNPHLPWLLAVSTHNKTRQHFSVHVYDTSDDNSLPHTRPDTVTQSNTRAPPSLMTPSLPAPIASYAHESVHCVTWLAADPMVLIVGTQFKYMRFYDLRQHIKLTDPTPRHTDTPATLSTEQHRLLALPPMLSVVDGSTYVTSLAKSYLHSLTSPSYLSTLTNGFLGDSVSTNSVKAHDRSVTRVQCDYDSMVYLASHGDDNLIKVWDVRCLRSHTPVSVINTDSLHIYCTKDDSFFAADTPTSANHNLDCPPIFTKSRADYMREILAVARLDASSSIQSMGWAVGEKEMLRSLRFDGSIRGVDASVSVNARHHDDHVLGSGVSEATKVVVNGVASAHIPLLPSLVRRHEHSPSPSLILHAHTQHAYQALSLDIAPALAWSRDRERVRARVGEDEGESSSDMVATTTTSKHNTSTTTVTVASVAPCPNTAPSQRKVEPWLRFRLPHFKLHGSSDSTRARDVPRDSLVAVTHRGGPRPLVLTTVTTHTRDRGVWLPRTVLRCKPLMNNCVVSLSGTAQTSHNTAASTSNTTFTHGQSVGDRAVYLVQRVLAVYDRLHSYVHFIRDLFHTQHTQHTSPSERITSALTRLLDGARGGMPISGTSMSWSNNDTLYLEATRSSQLNISTDLLTLPSLVLQLRSLVSLAATHSAFADGLSVRATLGYNLTPDNNVSVLEAEAEHIKCCYQLLIFLANLVGLLLHTRTQIVKALQLLLQSQLLGKNKAGVIMLRRQAHTVMLTQTKATVLDMLARVDVCVLEHILLSVMSTPTTPVGSVSPNDGLTSIDDLLDLPTHTPPQFCVDTVADTLPMQLQTELQSCLSSLSRLRRHVRQLQGVWVHVACRLPTLDITATQLLPSTHSGVEAFLGRSAHKLCSWARLCVTFNTHAPAADTDVTPSPAHLYAYLYMGTRTLVSLLPQTHTADTAGASVPLSSLEHMQHTQGLGTLGLAASSLPAQAFLSCFPQYVHPVRVPLTHVNPYAVFTQHCFRGTAHPVNTDTSLVRDEEVWGGWGVSADSADSSNTTKVSVCLYHHSHALLLMTVARLEQYGYFQTAAAFALAGGEVALALEVVDRTRLNTHADMVDVDLTEDNAFATTGTQSLTHTKVPTSVFQEYCRSLTTLLSHLSLALQAHTVSSLSLIAEHLPVIHCQSLHWIVSLFCSAQPTPSLHLSLPVSSWAILPSSCRHIALFAAGSLLPDSSLVSVVDAMTRHVVKRGDLTGLSLVGLRVHDPHSDAEGTAHPVVLLAGSSIETHHAKPTSHSPPHGYCVCGVCVLCLLQQYNDSTCDIATTALLATVTAILSVTSNTAHTSTTVVKSKASVVLERSVLCWIAVFQNLLNQNRQWVHRAQFDVLRGLLLKSIHKSPLSFALAEPSLLTTSSLVQTHSNTSNTGMTRVSSSNLIANNTFSSEVGSLRRNNSTMSMFSSPSSNSLHRSASVSSLTSAVSEMQHNTTTDTNVPDDNVGGSLVTRTSLQCVHCGSCLNDQSAPTQHTLDTQPTDPLIGPKSRCHRCGKTWVKCVLCLYPINVLKHGPHAHTTNTTTSPHNSGMARVSGSSATWCVRCNHGGHSQHMEEWFAINDECPVTECSCRCNKPM